MQSGIVSKTLGAKVFNSQMRPYIDLTREDLSIILVHSTASQNERTAAVISSQNANEAGSKLTHK